MVYVLADATQGATYVGVTVDVDRRLAEHNGQRRGGARRTQAGRPWSLVKVYGPFEDRSRALQVEAQVKKLRGKERLHWSPTADENQEG